MSNNDTATELEKLRADVAALSEARREKPAEATEPSRQEQVATDVVAESPAISDEERSQIEELGELLQQEIRDLPTITTLAVFSLGILMGRLMR